MGGDEHEISHSPTSQLEVEHGLTAGTSFTVKSACVFCS